MKVTLVPARMLRLEGLNENGSDPTALTTAVAEGAGGGGGGGAAGGGAVPEGAGGTVAVAGGLVPGLFNGDALGVAPAVFEGPCWAVGPPQAAIKRAAAGTKARTKRVLH